MADLNIGEVIDPSTHKRSGTAVKIPTSDLTTHGVIVGMTGSGKTGLGVVLIEEVLSAGVPCILIDPKGDLTNLALTFPNLAPSDFQPWVNEGDAQKAGLSVPDFAASQAKTWEDGLASWGIGKDRIQALRDKTRFTIYTPGSNAGVPINIVGSLQAPGNMDDMEIVNDEIEGFVTGLLGLVGVDADPLSSREHILLSNLISNAWANGRPIDLPALVGQVMTPPIRKLGVFDLDQFYPPKDRTELAMKLNGLLASASFAAWAEGQPLDIDAMLRSPDGKPSAAIITVAHLSDQERQFVVSMILSKLVTWMRRQSGTTDLRALLYMDEVAGYLPPTAMPPTKKPIMLLMKQARAFGVGVVLSTQNPVDIDYKAITNAGTWMVGKLQTDQDKNRLLDGMNASDGGVDISTISNTISGLGKREFVLRRAGKSALDVITSRWAMSYLRGPLTRDQIKSVVGVDRPAAPSAANSDASSGSSSSAYASSPAAATLADDQTPVMPEVQATIPVRYVHPSADWLHLYSANPNGTQFEAAALARARVRFDDEKAGLVADTEWECVLYPLTLQPDAAQNSAIDYDDRDLVTEAPAGASYTMPEGAIASKAYWADIERGLIDHLVRTQTMNVQANKALKMFSRTGESEADFAARCEKAASDQADTEAAALRGKYEDKSRRLQEQLDLSQQRLEAAKSATHAKAAGAILSTAGSILGSFLGGRSNAGSILGKVVRGAGRGAGTQTSRQRADVVETKVEQLTQDLQSVEDELTTELGDITDKWHGVASQIDSVPVSLERTDISIVQLQLAWIPVR
jgi:Helicase HerA, central domain